MSAGIVVIGPPDSLEGLRDRLESGAELQAFTDAEALEALDHVIRHKPRIIALDGEFASTSRGTALVNRIKDDPSLVACDIRVIARDGHIAPGPLNHTSAAIAGEGKALDQRGTRRAHRIAIKAGVEVMADGNPALVVNLSTTGVQIVSRTVLKPNQRVRLVFGEGHRAIRCNGSIAWAAFEMPKGASPQYRAGIDFIAADTDAIAAFARKHRRD